MNKKIKSLLQQAEVYKKQGLLNEAKNKYDFVKELIQNNDAFVELLKGRIEATLGKTRKAINHYSTALTKPSAIKNSGITR